MGLLAFCFSFFSFFFFLFQSVGPLEDCCVADLTLGHVCGMKFVACVTKCVAIFHIKVATLSHKLVTNIGLSYFFQPRIFFVLPL